MKKLLALAVLLTPSLTLANPIKLRGSLDVQQRSLTEDATMLIIRDQAGVAVFQVDDDGNITFNGTCSGCGGATTTTDVIKEMTAGATTLQFQNSAATPYLSFTYASPLTTITALDPGVNDSLKAATGTASTTWGPISVVSDADIVGFHDWQFAGSLRVRYGVSGATLSISYNNDADEIFFNVPASGYFFQTAAANSHNFQFGVGNTDWTLLGGGATATLRANSDTDEEIENNATTGWAFDTASTNTHDFKVGATTELSIAAAGITADMPFTFEDTPGTDYLVVTSSGALNVTETLQANARLIFKSGASQSIGEMFAAAGRANFTTNVVAGTNLDLCTVEGCATGLKITLGNETTGQITSTATHATIPYMWKAPAGATTATIQYSAGDNALTFEVARIEVDALRPTTANGTVTIEDTDGTDRAVFADTTTTLVGSVAVGSVAVGSGTSIAKIQKTTTASTDLGGAITATCTAETNFAITGVAVGDACTVSLAGALAATDWVECRTLVDNVALKYCSQGAAIDPAAQVFHITTIEY